jgi:hypothetical protein
MSFFSRLFWCTDCEASNTARMAAEDKIRELQAELLQTKDELAQSRAEAVHSVQHVADWMSQSLFGRKIYGPAPDLPEHPIGPKAAQEAMQRRPQARTLCNQLEKEFYERMGEPLQ